MSYPLVSILTPFKNTSKYISECIESITNQTYTNWELLIVDDNSTDNSYSIVASFAKKDNRIKLYKFDGQGIIEALRVAFHNSSGNFITRMDSDDIMHSNKIEYMVNDLLCYGKNHIALGLVKYFCETKIGNGFKRYENWLNSITIKGTNFNEIYKECVIASPCWMVFKEDLIKCDAFNPNRYPEDYDLAFRFLKQNLKCIPNQNVIHFWRDYKTRTSRTHKHYAQNSFLDLKIYFFLDLHYDANRQLTVWGAGQKGKTIAKLLQKHNIPFLWICDNPNKIGKTIYGKTMYNFEYLNTLDKPQSIVTVANTKAQREITSYFNLQQMKAMTDYFFFC